MILITGGAGFIGSNFVHVWLSEFDEAIVNLDALSYAGNPLNLSALAGDGRHMFVHGSIGDRALVEGLLAEHKPRAIINFAAESHVDRSIHGPAAFMETNVMGTFQLLEATRSYVRSLDADGRNAFRFVHVSTDEVYGTLAPNDPAFTEETQYRPNSPYAASKASSDHLVRAWHHTYSLPVVTTNCSNNYGPYQFPEKLIPLIIHNGLRGHPLPVYGDGLQVRDWLFVEDHCRAIIRVLEQGRIGSVYNIGGRCEQTNLNIVRAICSLIDEFHPRPDGSSHRELITYVTDRPGHDRRYAINAARIENELDWHPNETLETGLRKTVAWYLNHSAWVESITSGAYRDWIATHYGT